MLKDGIECIRYAHRNSTNSLFRNQKQKWPHVGYSSLYLNISREDEDKTKMKSNASTNNMNLDLVKNSDLKRVLTANDIIVPLLLSTILLLSLLTSGLLVTLIVLLSRITRNGLSQTEQPSLITGNIGNFMNNTLSQDLQKVI